MRADARENREHILAVAREVVAEQGADASLRDIARRAEVGPATLFRHFPTRETLLEAMLRDRLDVLSQAAIDLEATATPEQALVTWLREAVAFLRTYNGVVAVMTAALADPNSALHASCERLRSSGIGLLRQAQANGAANADLDGDDLLALLGALGWIGDQPAFAARSHHLFDVIAGAILAQAPARRI